jgi:tetratricopeptide (TPR) repeat protein
MRRVARATPVLALMAAAGAGAFAAEPPQPPRPEPQSSTVFGPTNLLLAQGATALEEGRIEEGIQLTLEGLKSPTDPQNRAAGHSNLCAGYAALRQWDEAIKHCNTALEIDPYNWRTFNNRAGAHSGKGDYDAAIRDLRAGLELAPRSRTLHESLRIVQQNKRLVAARGRSAVRSP